MVSTYKKSGPPPALVMLVAVGSVVGCALLWVYALSYLESNAPSPEERATRRAAQSGIIQETFDLGPTPTPKPTCEFYIVHVSSANIRICPDESCTRRDRVPYEYKVCVYGTPEANFEYPQAEEWFIIDINHDGVFQDLAYMHGSTIKPLNPTPIPSDTPRPSPSPLPLPTVTRTPSPQESATPNAPINPTVTPISSPARLEF